VYEVKGQLEFVEAAAQVRRSIPNAHFVLAGIDLFPGTYARKVRDRIERLGASGYIHYLGYRSDYTDIMKSLDRLAEDATIDDFIEQLCFMVAVEHGLAQADAGEMVSHEEVVELVKQWLK
jgi:glycosyltransferase involved in cell wall biosynthesis